MTRMAADARTDKFTRLKEDPVFLKEMLEHYNMNSETI